MTTWTDTQVCLRLKQRVFPSKFTMKTCSMLTRNPCFVLYLTAILN